MLNVVRYRDARCFLERSERWLLEAEREHSVVLSVAHLLLGGNHPFEAPVYMATVEEGGAVAGCALRPPPDGLSLTRMPAAAMPALARDLATFYEAVPDVSGPEPEVTAFARAWVQERGGRWSLAARLRWYASERVVEPERPVRGALRLADSSDLSLVTAWARDYVRGAPTTVDVPAFFVRRIRTGSLYLWCDGEPTSLVAVSGLTPGSVRISAVYTPPPFRGRGYASTAVAQVTRRMLDGWRPWCVLSADLANPTANDIYRRIGYRPLCDSARISFSPS